MQVQSAMQTLELAVSSTVVVVGSGPAGVELATTVADTLGKKSRVSLISTGNTLPSITSMITSSRPYQCWGGTRVQLSHRVCSVLN
jgi:NADH dehydrogenase FAD-containing subunit